VNGFATPKTAQSVIVVGGGVVALTCEVAQLASELIAWTQILAFADLPVRVWEPKRLRLRILAVAGRIITSSRRHILRLSKRWPWTDLILTAHQRLTLIT
jgi:hypothetical protein